MLRSLEARFAAPSPRFVTLRQMTKACEGPGCASSLPATTTGRPGRYYSSACRVRDHRHRNAAAILVEVDQGSASSRGRPPERAWLVRIRRGERTVIVAIGLRRTAAERLGEQLTDLFGPAPPNT